MVPFQEIEIDRHSLEIIRPSLGHGSFAQVYKGKDYIWKIFSY